LIDEQMFATVHCVSENLAAEAMQRVDELEGALGRLEFMRMVGPDVHNLAEQYRPMFFGVRQSIESWERIRLTREES
jgi:hypothetical protein